MSFGEFIKDHRIGLGKSLRAFCEANGYDPGNHSKLERGIFNPPEDEPYMLRLGNALGIQQGTGDWFEFHNLASIVKQRIPKPLMDDAEVVAKCPSCSARYKVSPCRQARWTSSLSSSAAVSRDHGYESRPL